MTENHLSVLPDGVPNLNTFYVYLTKGCNLACRHCWLSPEFKKGGQTGGHLDFDLFQLAIQEGKPLGLQNVKLTGGEPLLHPNFLKFTDFLAEQDIGVSIETNGTLLTQDMAKHLKEHSSVGFISVSLDGARPQTHNSFRGVKDSFEKACNAVRYLAEVGYDPQVIMSVHAGNVDEIEAEVHLVEELGAGSLKFNLVQAAGRGEAMEKRNELLDIRQLIEIGQWIENELQSQVDIRLFYSWPMAFHSLRRLRSGNAGTCGIFGILGILASGQLAMCGIGVDIPELVYGQLGVDPLEDIWVNNTMLNKLRQELPEDLEGVCGNCILRQQCLGNCVADNYHQSHRLTAPFWFCQQADEMGLFPKSRLK